MCGNAHEWCNDYYDFNFYRTNTDWTDPVGPGSNSSEYRVTRGGNFGTQNTGVQLSSIYRVRKDGDLSSHANYWSGFRVVR